MTRARRYLLNGLTALSLLLCVGTCVLWVRSYWAGDFYFFPGPSDAGLGSTRGTLVAYGRPAPAPYAKYGARPPHRGYERLSPASVTRPRPSRANPGFRGAFEFAGVSWFLTYGGPAVGASGLRAYFAPIWFATAPHWVVAALTGPLPAIVLYRRIRRRRAVAGRCPDCGYDLRATPARCPECGRVA